MKLPVYWLQKYIDVSGLKAEALAELLTMSGTAVERVDTHAGENVLDIEVTTNRPDCLSMLGLANEVAALTGKKVNIPAITTKLERLAAAKRFKVEVKDASACPKYTVTLIENVSVKSSAADVEKCLSLCDAKAISNVVDATNYVLFETGQPLHAFDFDKIEGAKIIVRFSRKGEKFEALDGNVYELDDKTLVIADEKKPIAIAGVIGGKSTEVGLNTKNVLLEAAYFDPALVRTAAKKYKISTESSYRFERSVTFESVETNAARAVDLITTWSSGKASEYISFVSTPQKIASDIIADVKKINALLGMNIPAERMKNILLNLGFQVEVAADQKLKVSHNPARRDVAQQADIAEEILRIEGFDKAPVSIPMTRHADMKGLDLKPLGILKLKSHMASLGFREIVTFSLLSKKAIEDSALLDEKNLQRIANPLSFEQAYFRPSLLPGLLGAVIFNIHRKADGIKFFEIGNIYSGNEEKTMLSFGIHGMIENHWKRKVSASFYDVKGIAENILKSLGFKQIVCEELAATASFENAARISSTAGSAIEIYKVSPAVLKHWDIPGDFFFAQMHLDTVFEKISQIETRVQGVAKFPSVRRDIAMIVSKEITAEQIRLEMKKSAGESLRAVELFDEYIGKNIPAGKRSLAFSLEYQKNDGTFTEEEITRLQTKVGDSIKSRFQAEFR